MSIIACRICGGTLCAAPDGQCRCNVCGVMYDQQTLRSMLSDEEQSTWSFDVDENGVRLREYRGEESVPSIPQQIQGHPVYALGKGLFHSRNFLHRVDVPEGVQVVESLAFCQSIYLESVTLPQSLTTLGNDVFSRCRSLRAVSVPPSVTDMGTAVFSGCTQMSSLTLPDTLRVLPMLTLFDCGALTELQLPPQLEEIHISALCNCRSLISLVLPETLRVIASMAFYGCKGLRELHIPAGVTEIGDLAFGTVQADKPLLLVHSGSYAHTWAKEHHCPYRILP